MKKILLLLLLTTLSLLKAEMLTLNDNNYKEKLNKNKKIVVMFSAKWCGACKEMKPIYQEMAKNYKGEVVFAAIDTDESENVASLYNIESIPTTILFENGKEVNRQSGALDKSELLMFIDVEKAIATLSEQCFKGNAKVCMDIADIYEEDDVVKKDYVKVFEYTKRACEFNSNIGCNNLGYIYGNAEGVELDLEKSIHYYTEACKKDYALACLNLGGLFKEGWYGAKIDNNQAFSYFEKASTIDSDGEGYYELGQMYKEGLGTVKNETKAEELFQKACNDGYEDACTNTIDELSENDTYLESSTTDIVEEANNFGSKSTKILLIILGLYITLGIIVIIYNKFKRKKEQ